MCIHCWVILLYFLAEDQKRPQLYFVLRLDEARLYLSLLTLVKLKLVK